jgi:hypothetical protein
MKKTAILVILFSLLLVAGCTTQPSTPGSSGTGSSLPMSANPLVQGKSLPMNEHITFGSGNKTFDASIYSLEVGPVQENGDQVISIYMAAKNTGSDRLRLVWYCKLTDLNGKTYGGIGISHAGSGARSNWLEPNGGLPELARDYVVVRSDRDLATLKNGAVLDVYFMEKLSDDIPVSDKPDYHASWIINPETIH